MGDVACQLLICVAGAPWTSTSQQKPFHNSFSQDSTIPTVSISAIKLRSDVRSKLGKGKKKIGLTASTLSIQLLPLLLLIDPFASQNWNCLHSRENLLLLWQWKWVCIFGSVCTLRGRFISSKINKLQGFFMEMHKTISHQEPKAAYARPFQKMVEC